MKPITLTGWKGIACALDVSVRTAQSWRVSRGLPVFNVTPRLVAARPDDLDAWLRDVARRER